MDIKMRNIVTQIALVVFICMFTMVGCKSSEKQVKKPDPYEKWRAMAEKSKGSTPSPRNYDLNLKDSIKNAKEKADPAQAKIIEKPEVVNQLPTMPITMKMHDVSVSVLLRTLARVANINIMINDTVTGKAKINIHKLAWDKAFKGLLTTYGLTYQWADEVLRVITVEDLNKEIALMEARQKFEKSKKEHAIVMLSIEKEEEKLDPLITKIVKIDYADLKPLRDNLEKYLLSSTEDIELNKQLGNDVEKQAAADGAKMRGNILMDEATNSLIIQATASDIKRVMPIIKQLDTPSEQILIEAHIVEATSDTAKELGIQWGGLGLHTAGNNNTWLGGPVGTYDTSLLVNSDDATATVPAGSAITHLPPIGNSSNFPSSTNAGTSGWTGLTLSLLNQNIGDYLLYAQLTALQEAGKLNILSNPSITTLDHRKATIESGEEVPFQTVEDDEVKIEFKKAVIKLEVTPHVVNKNVIRLDILTHKDELDFTRTVLGNPTIITKNAETRVNLFDGQTTVIGGLTKEKLQESKTGIPWLMDVPGIGRLFRSDSNAADMDELLIFITPHILKQRPNNNLPVKPTVPPKKQQ